MPRVSEEHRQAQRERIVAAALAVAQGHGLAGVSMNDVIRESGLSAGAIYGYFKNKDELVADVASGIIGGRLEEIEALAQTRPVPHPLTIARRIATSVPPEIVAGGLVLEIWASAARDDAFAGFAREQLLRITAALETFLAAWFEQEGRDPESAAALGTSLAPVLLGVTQGYLVRVAVDGPEGGEAYLDSLDALAALLPG